MSTKTQIDANELSLLKDQSFLLAKKVINQKVTGLLKASQIELANYVESLKLPLPLDVSLVFSKVAKGEKYEDLPYWVTDFPAKMKGKDVWTFRTVVWWGNFISFSLIVSGKYKTHLDVDLSVFNHPELFYTLADSPWNLEFVDSNQKQISETDIETLKQHFLSHTFMKLSMKENLNQVNNLPTLSVKCFEKIVSPLYNLA